MKTVITTIVLSVFFLTVNAQKAPASKLKVKQKIEDGIQLLNSIYGNLRIGNLCTENGIKFNEKLLSAERAKYGSFEVYKAVRKSDGKYYPGQLMNSQVSFGDVSGSSVPFTISKFTSTDRVFIKFKAQDRFFENSILKYEFTSDDIEVSNNILLTSRPFIVTVNCNQTSK